MKKGKRQIVEKNIFQNEQPQITTTATTTSAQPGVELDPSIDSKQSLQPVTTPQKSSGLKAQKRQAGDDSSISPISQQKSKAGLQQQNTDEKSSLIPGDEKDEKKSRIEMLKQKYLKKNENKAQMKSSIPCDQGSTSEKNESRSMIIEVEEKREMKGEIPMTKNKKENKIEIVKERPQPEIVNNNEREIKKEIEENIVPPPEENISKEEGPPTDKEPKKPFKIPPPPKKGIKPPPPPVSSKQVRQPDSPPKDSKRSESGSVPLIQMVKTRERNQPPPPKKQPGKSSTLQEILSKRLKKQQPLEVKADLDQNQGHFDQQPESRVDPSLVPSSMPLDEEYLDKKSQKKVTNIKQPPQRVMPTTTLTFDSSLALRTWCANPDPDTFFNTILASNDDLMLMIRRNTSPELQLQSKNTSYNPIISRLVTQFIFNSKNELSEDQKHVLSDLALEYFYSDPNTLATQFLLILVKLGERSLAKYIQFFRHNLNQYCLTIFNYRSYFSAQELAVLVNFILEQLEITEQTVYLLIFIQPTEQLLSFLSARSIEDDKSLIISLVASQHVLKTNKGALGIHLRLINNLMDTIPRDNSLLEGILNYLNRLESQEKYYNVQKQLKLKLINMMSNTVSTKQEAPERDRDPKDEGKGFMGIWSKAIDKFKTATTQFADKDKPTKGPQREPEQPEDDITYDPVLKRYLINGKVPEDEDRKPNPTKAPPPPPPKTSKPSAPPPPGKKRTVTAINRYA